MIVRPHHGWYRLLFVWDGSVLGDILAQLLVVLVISVAVTWTHGQVGGYAINLGASPFAAIGVPIAVFLGFRNSASFDRYWEGRKLWGSLLNASRSLLRQAFSLARLSQDDPRLRELLGLLIAFVNALRHQLRKSDPEPDLLKWLSPDAYEVVRRAHYRPAIILNLMGGWVSERRQEEQFGEITATAFDQNLSHLADVLGGCERIASTPLPLSYSVMIHRTVYLYCLLLPFGLASSVGAFTPVVCLLVAYSFLALETLAQELEEPFGTSRHDLPLQTMCSGIEETLREMAGEVLAPRIVDPKQYVLL
jgi:putative membrane protein